MAESKPRRSAPPKPGAKRFVHLLAPLPVGKRTLALALARVSVWSAFGRASTGAVLALEPDDDDESSSEVQRGAARQDGCHVRW